MEQSEQKRDIKPTYNLSSLTVGDKEKNIRPDVIFVTFLEMNPRLVEWTDKATHEKKTGSVIEVVVDKKETTNGNTASDGQEYSIWISSDTLKTDINKLSEAHSGLKGLKAKIYAEWYKHMKYGRTKAYRVRSIN